MVMTMAIATAAAIRATTAAAAAAAVGVTITATTTMTAMAGGTNNNLLKAQLRLAHDGDEDDMPGMCLAVMVVAAMTVWEGGARRQR